LSIIFNLKYYVSADCVHALDSTRNSLLKTTTHFIKTAVLPPLEEMVQKYSAWYSFYPPSELKKFLAGQNIHFDRHFCMQELIDQLTQIIYAQNMYQNGNENVIILNPMLQLIFNETTLYVPNLKNYLLPHLIVASPELSIHLQNQQIHHELYIESPKELIYKDPSSTFWCHPLLDVAMHNCTGNTYSWHHLLANFIEFCSSNTIYFQNHDEKFVFIKENTPISALFSFQYFHLTQCEEMLMKVTKFLGRKNNLTQMCPDLKYNSMFSNLFTHSKYDEAIRFLDFIINTNNDSLPYIANNNYLS